MVSDTTRTGNGMEPQAQTREALALPDDVLSRIVTETERQFTARAARPSPIHLKSWEEIERFAEKAARSGMVPKDYIGKPDAICIAVQMGSELGLAPMQALTNIAVVNGRPSVWGDAMPGLCRSSGMCRSIREWHTGEGETLAFHCEAIRRDDPNPVLQSFSVAQAKKAGLWGKAVWASYPDRMLQMRARGFALRDAFPDVLRGLISAEEAADIPWEDTGLPPVGAPPVATAQPIARDAAVASRMMDNFDRGEAQRQEKRHQAEASTQPRRTARQLLEAIQRDADAALTLEDIENLAARSDEVRAIRALSETHAAQAALTALLDAAKARLSAFEQGQPAAEDSLDDALPPDLPPTVDADARRVAELVALIGTATSAEQIDRQILGSMINTALIQRFTRDGRNDFIAQIEAARQARLGALEA